MSTINSIQRGTGSTPFPYATANITISAVNTAKATVEYLGTAPNSTSTPYWSSQGYFALTSSTNLMFVPRPSAGPGQVYSWEIVEYI